jgi:hypothetical protein
MMLDTNFHQPATKKYRFPPGFCAIETAYVINYFWFFWRYATLCGTDPLIGNDIIEFIHTLNSSTKTT